MRPLEAVLIGLLALACVSFFVPAKRRYRWMLLLPAAAVLAAVLHLVIEGGRWAMQPAYFLTGLTVLLTLRSTRVALNPEHRDRLTDRKWLRISGAIAGLLALVFVSAVPVLFPHLELPEPTGPFSIGTIDLYLVDKSRPETFTPNPDDRREVFVRAWYPAEVSPGAEPVSFGEHAHAIADVLSRGNPLPRYLLRSRPLTDTHSFRRASLPEGKERFPIVLFSHAYWAGFLQSTVLMEELASHGYVALSVGHPYETPYALTRKGFILGFDPYNAEFRLRGEERARALDIERRLVMTHDRDEIEALLRQHADSRPKMLESLRIWTDDIRFVIDELEAMSDGKGPFGSRLDTGRIGVLGHSFGGAASHQACLTDARCKAGVNLDGLGIGDAIERNLTVPFMFVHHDNPGAVNKTPNLLFFERAEGAAYLLWVRGTRHLNFSDFSLYGRGSLIRLMGTIGEIDGRRCLKIQNDYVREFFDKHLKGVDSGLLDGPSAAYPEVEISVR
jgi:predicted dienelactone hydrolase